MQSYSINDEVVALLAELYRLRDALIRSTHDRLHALDLLRSLRVLVLDGGDALLLRLAAHFRIEHRVIATPPARPPGGRKDTPEPGSLVMSGMVGVVAPNHFARWRALRGFTNPAKAPGLDLSFEEYLDLAVAAHRDHGTPISRRQLLSDIANQAFGVHGSQAYPEHVEMAWLELENGPHYLDLSQELAYECLDYGSKVVSVAMARLGLDAASLVAPGNVPIRGPRCPACQAELSLLDFTCPSCGANLLAPVNEGPTIHTLSDALRTALREPTGTVATIVQLPALLDQEAGDLLIARARSSNGRSAELSRTRDVTLRWAVSDGTAQHVAELDLKKRPLKIKPDDFMLLIVGWSPERAIVSIGADPPDMDASSDGLPAFPAAVK
jgi:hypothetical protein